MANNSGDRMVYPIDHMREVAARILAQADSARFQHDEAWQQIMTFIQNNFDPSLHEAVTGLLQPYANRLRATYEWQMDLASALFEAVDLIDTTEQNIAGSFTTQDTRHGNIP